MPKPKATARDEAPRKASGTNTHIAGEFFVGAELAKRGYSVSLTMGNAKAVDLFAERDGTAICVQVKAIAHKRNVGWADSEPLMWAAWLFGSPAQVTERNPGAASSPSSTS